MSSALPSSSSPSGRAPARRSRPVAALARSLVIAMVAGAALVGVQPGTPSASAATNTCGRADFADAGPGSGFYAAITWMACRKISVGYATDNTFRKNQSVTRGEMAAFMYRQVQPAHKADGKRYFTDVNPGGANYDAITWFAEAGISVGYRDGTFKPGQAVTRGEFAAFLNGLSGVDAPAPARSPFADMGPGSNFYQAATWLRREGITSGYGDGTFRPSRPVSRAETAQFLMSADTTLRGRGDVPPPSQSHGTDAPAPAWATAAAKWAVTQANDSRVSYQWGGNGPLEYDCSGFVIGAFTAGGKGGMPRRADDQYRAAASYVPLSQIRVGDLVYWSNGTSVYHTALYIGGGKIAHARNEDMGVAVTDLHYSPYNMLTVAGRY